MSLYKQSILVIVAAGWAFTARAQASFSGWLIVNNQVTLNKKFSLLYAITVRSTDKWLHRQTLLIRPGFQYRFNARWNIAAGYSFVNSRQTIDDFNKYTVEHQLWEQLVFTHNLKIGRALHKKPGRLTHRVRVEERFIPTVYLQNNAVKTNGTVYATRLRYLVRDITPLKASPVFDKGAYIALQNELIFAVTGREYLSGRAFDQNRSYLATGYRFSKNADLEAGYMYRYIASIDNGILHDHVAQVMLFFRF